MYIPFYYNNYLRLSANLRLANLTSLASQSQIRDAPLFFLYTQVCAQRVAPPFVENSPFRAEESMADVEGSMADNSVALGIRMYNYNVYTYT